MSRIVGRLCCTLCTIANGTSRCASAADAPHGHCSIFDTIARLKGVDGRPDEGVGTLRWGWCLWAFHVASKEKLLTCMHAASTHATPACVRREPCNRQHRQHRQLLKRPGSRSMTPWPRSMRPCATRGAPTCKARLAALPTWLLHLAHTEPTGDAAFAGRGASRKSLQGSVRMHPFTRGFFFRCATNKTGEPCPAQGGAAATKMTRVPVTATTTTMKRRARWT